MKNDIWLVVALLLTGGGAVAAAVLKSWVVVAIGVGAAIIAASLLW